MKPRRAWVAAVLALAFPGLGDVYVRRGRRGIALFVVGEVFDVAIYALIGSQAPTQGTIIEVFAFLAAGIILFHIAPAVSAARYAQRIGAVPRGRWFTSTWAALVAMLLLGEGGDAALMPLAWGTFSIPSESMEPTLLVGDYLVADERPSALAAVAPGDVVIFKGQDGSTDFVKRVVGIGGDTVRMVGGRIEVNGSFLRMADLGAEAGVHRVLITATNGRSYVALKREGVNPLDNTAAVTVPAGSYFMMGDNLDNSLDSRVPRPVGIVPAERLVGVARTLYWSRDRARAFSDIR